MSKHTDARDVAGWVQLSDEEYRLFAAAPDLLTALEDMTAVAALSTKDGCTAEEGEHYDTRLFHRDDNYNAAVDAARAALAKARGE